MHPRRRFSLTTFNDPKELAKKLAEYTWTGWTAFHKPLADKPVKTSFYQPASL